MEKAREIKVKADEEFAIEKVGYTLVVFVVSVSMMMMYCRPN
jgi:hypothetical protein